MTDEVALRRWAASAAGAPTLVQLSHPGRQTNRLVQPHPVAPSDGPAVPIAGLFARPRALTLPEIEEIRDRFIDAAERVVGAGFAGVEVHGAHGYLLDSFLDTAHNRRVDAYGGSLENRARLLVEIVAGMRSVLPAQAPIAIKLDSREGGDEELAQLAGMLESAGADLLEISGGNYESPAMLGFDSEGRELVSEHESPFWASAAAVSAATSVPVILTGGFKTRAEVDRALAGGRLRDGRRGTSAGRQAGACRAVRPRRGGHARPARSPPGWPRGGPEDAGGRGRFGMAPDADGKDSRRQAARAAPPRHRRGDRLHDRRFPPGSTGTAGAGEVGRAGPRGLPVQAPSRSPDA